jgi:hypothetical protein
MAWTPFARALWKPVGTGFITELLEDSAFGEGVGNGVFGSDTFEGRRMQVEWELSATGVEVTTAITTHDFINITDDETDNTWVDEDFEAVEDAWSEFYDDITAMLNDEVRVVEARWYKFGPQINPTAEDPQPAVRVHEVNDAMSGAGAPLPPQVAISVTERTPVRKRWGRFYLPYPDSTVISGAGTVGGSTCTALADAIELAYEACITAEIIPVVWSPTVKRAYAVTMLQVDNIFDVIRSRRYTTPTVREQRDGT